MTIKRRFTREHDLHDWPLFADGPPIDNIGVISIESIRSYPETIENAVGRASAVLTETWPKRWRSPVLLAVSPPHRPYNRLIERKVRSSSIWKMIVDDETSLPHGRVQGDVMIDSDDGIGFAGLIEFDPNDIPGAMEITRRKEAVCVIDLDSDHSELLNNATTLAESSYQPGKKLMLLTAIARMGPRTAVLRAYGAFDDRYVGIDIFAHNKVLDPIWDSLPEE